MISIIIPVYNVEKYLRQCVNSVIAQTFTDWELLLVDDGSPDGSGKICDEYAGQNSRVRVFHKTNGGVSSARNLGLDNANGDWLTFIDADDFIAPTFLEQLYKPIPNNPEIDFVQGGCSNYANGEVTGIEQNYEDYVGNDPARLFNQFRGLTVAKLFSLANVNPWIDGSPLRFDEKMKIAEDMAFTLDYLITVKKYAFVSETGYYYRKDNIQSATNIKRSKNADEVIYGYNRIVSSAFRYADMHRLNIRKLPLRRSALAKITTSVILVLSDKKDKSDKINSIKETLASRTIPLLRYYPYKDIIGKLVKIVACTNNLFLICKVIEFRRNVFRKARLLNI